MGPWTNEDEKEPPYIPRQVREMGPLKPWQQEVVRLSKEWDTRSIYVIVDKQGGIGKSTLAAYMDVHGLGLEIPFANDYRDIMRMVMDMPSSNCYIIDMPRALKKEKLYQMWSAIESVKNGYVFDDRYTFKRKRFDCPQIFVYTNTEPDISLLSRDRWKILTVKDDGNF